MTGEPDTSRVLPLVKAVGTPYAGNPHVRCEEGVGVTSPPTLPSLRFKAFRFTWLDLEANRPERPASRSSQNSLPRPGTESDGNDPLKT